MFRIAIATVCLLLPMVPGLATAANLLNEPESVEYDAPRDRYLVSNVGDGNIIQINADGEQSYFNTQLSFTTGLHIIGDTLYASSSYGQYAGVVGYDLTGDTMIFYIPIPGVGMVNDLTHDTSGYLYATDYDYYRLYKIRLSDHNVSTFISTGLDQPNGIYFDAANNRVLLLNEQAVGAPIVQVNLEDSTFTTVVATGLSTTDGITRDAHGNWYVSDWVSDAIYCWDADFEYPRTRTSNGHNNPADIFYNPYKYEMAIPNYGANELTLIPMRFSSRVVGYHFSDDVGGDGDGVLEAGETIELVVDNLNEHVAALTEVTLNLSTGDGGLTIVTGSVQLGAVPPSEVRDNQSAPLSFEIDAAYESQMTSFSLEIIATTDYGVDTVVTSLEKAIGGASVLLVDDTRGDNSSSYLQMSLLSLGTLYDRWISTEYTSPDSAVLCNYGVVLWFTGDYHADPLDAEQVAVLRKFMDAGGSLLLTGQGIAAQLNNDDPAFLNGYLMSEYIKTHTTTFLESAPGAEVLHPTTDYVVIGGAGGASNQSATDQITPLGEAVAELKYYNQSGFAAVSYSAQYRLLFCSFGLEAVVNGNAQYTPRDTLMAQALEFLDWANPNFCCVIRGDLDYNGAGPDIADLVFLVDYMFSGGQAPFCTQAADIDGNGAGPDIADLVYLVDYMFSGGPIPPPCS
ncbi:MAG: hypothetical protein OEV49_12465 [candidate division Zixibacteria bacterium]|nr:hypothetical protein [candidate division Zixibacteria bacterium]MDH3935911.1 hypothetical protein [candidate division Zixibacteria bacterium]MDH4032822.1 hypothetical protein [candidate division Zixibacteria bacterium]